MKLSHLTNIFRPSTPPAALSPERAVRNDFAYMCRSCGWTLEGLNQGRCHFCGSPEVFHPLSLYEEVKRKAFQKAKIDATTTAAQRRREHNDLALLTEFRNLPPKDAA